VSLFDTYRAVLLAEILVIGVLYSWAAGKYLRHAREDDDEWLRHFRQGQAARVIGVLIILIVFAIAVISAFGRGDIGRVLYNLLVQVALLCFAFAWGRVDLPRFRAITGRPHAAIAEIDRLDRETMLRRRRRNAGA
jgi:uncharacterized membrane protein YkvI